MDEKSDLRYLGALAEFRELCSNNPRPMDTSVSHAPQVFDVILSVPGRPMRGSGYL
ncbi:hypothetical protein J2853_005258 [Streptosporangium lutulentum]|uniref:Uncharacterized protein n=1 Tax=Streptosporangium lutulentum TaxID=1461250 RepID=A0ABT9QH10_9ACTN|nr:hypothetical protein [Streptosporangium lutulentum]